MQKQSMSTTEPRTTFNPSVCKRPKLKADYILIPLLSLAYLFKWQTHFLTLRNINVLLTVPSFLYRSNFLAMVVAWLGYDVMKTNLVSCALASRSQLGWIDHPGHYQSIQHCHFISCRVFVHHRSKSPSRVCALLGNGVANEFFYEGLSLGRPCYCPIFLVWTLAQWLVAYISL